MNRDDKFIQLFELLSEYHIEPKKAGGFLATPLITRIMAIFKDEEDEEYAFPGGSIPEGGSPAPPPPDHKIVFTGDPS